MQKFSVEFRITDQIKILHARMLRSPNHYPAHPVVSVTSFGQALISPAAPAPVVPRAAVLLSAPKDRRMHENEHAWLKNGTNPGNTAVLACVLA